MNWHRHGRKIAVAFLLLLVAAIVAGILARKSGNLPSVVLKDGKVIQLVGVTVGPHHELPRSRPREVLHGIAPQAVKKVLGPNFGSKYGFGSENGMALWMMTYDPTQDSYSGMGYKVVLMDEHGCEFSSNGMGGTSDGVFSASIVSFPIYPRRQAKFVCRILNPPGIYAESEVLGEMTIENPDGGSCADFIPEPVPITKTNWPIVARLESFDPTNGAKVTLLGEGALEWRLRRSEYEDESGNRGWRIFCPKEEVWKYRATYFRTEHGKFESNELWSLPVTNLPAAGTLVPSGATNVVGGFPVKVLYWAGAGTYTLSNDVCVAAAAWGPGSRSDFGSTSHSHRGVNVRTLKFGYEKPFVIVEHPGLGQESEFMLRVSQGDEVTAMARGASGLDGKWFYELASIIPDRSWETNGLVDHLDVIVQRARTIEFFVSPNQPEK